MSDLQAKAKATGKAYIIVAKGTYSGTLTISSDKTIVGKEPGVTINGNVSISGSKNVILRNIAVRGLKCGTYEECKAGSDAVSVQNGATNIWLDHLDVADGQDGNMDITKAADFVTVTWCKFSYTYAKEHRFSNLISSADNVEGDSGKLNITYAYNWWADKIVQRQVRGRSGKIYFVNNLLTSTESDYGCGPGVDMKILIQNNVFNIGKAPAVELFTGTPQPIVKSVGNIGTASVLNSINQGTMPSFPYTLKNVVAATAVDAMVRPQAGNTMTFSTVSVLDNSSNKRVASSPMLIQSKGNSWSLLNPGINSVEFVVVDPSGRTVVERTVLQSEKVYTLPALAHTQLFVRFIGQNAPAEIRIPTNF